MCCDLHPIGHEIAHWVQIAAHALPSAPRASCPA